MTVQVIFFSPEGVGPTDNAPGVGAIRAREAVTIPGSTTNVVQAGETVMVYNGETGAVLVAFGKTPDATATDANGVTSAGFPVPSSQLSAPIVANTGAKINVAALP